jgi:hypothetical protein
MRHVSIAKTSMPLKLAWQQVPRGGGGVTTYFFFSLLLTQQTHVTVYHYFLTRSCDSLVQIHTDESLLYI